MIERARSAARAKTGAAGGAAMSAERGGIGHRPE